MSPPLQVVISKPSLSAVKRSGDLDLELVWNVRRGMDNSPASFGVSVTFRCWAMAISESNWRHDIITLTFDLWSHHARVVLLRQYTRFEVPRPSGSEFYGWFYVTALISGPVTLTFIFSLSTLNGVTGHSCHGLPCYQFSACYVLPVWGRSVTIWRHRRLVLSAILVIQYVCLSVSVY